MLITAIAFAALAQVPLRKTSLEDGTGTIGLPAGWSIQGNGHGQVSANDDAGDTVVLGMPWTILDPTSSVAGLPSGSQVAAARPGDLGGALRSVLAHNGGGRLTLARAQRAQGVNGAPSAFVYYEFDQGGRSYAAVGYFAALVFSGQPAWQLYTSALLAPRARFVKQLPTLLAIYKSWHPNGANPVEGSHSWQMDRILDKRRESFEKIQQQFREQL